MVRLARFKANGVPARDTRVQETTDEQRAVAAQARSVAARLSFRLPRNDAILMHYMDCVSSLNDIVPILRGSGAEDFSQHDDRLRELDSKLAQSNEQFLDAARARYAVQVGGRPWYRVFRLRRGTASTH